MITLAITPDGGARYEVVADSRDVIEWELRGKGRHMGMFAQPRMLDLSELAFHACTRQKLWQSGDLAEFRAANQVAPVQTSPVDTDDGSGRDGLDPTRATA